MIIRSQDKKELHNFDRISNVCVLPCYRDEHKFIIEVNSQKTIGTYSTEEKAIKVLDMIEDAYVNCNCNYVHNDVFQMPQDDEVEDE